MCSITSSIRSARGTAPGRAAGVGRLGVSGTATLFPRLRGRVTRKRQGISKVLAHQTPCAPDSAPSRSTPTTRQLLARRSSRCTCRRRRSTCCACWSRPGRAWSTRHELHDRIWPGTFVVDANLSVLVGEIRRALGDNAQTPRFIRTVHKVGYAFCGDAARGCGAPPLRAERRVRRAAGWRGTIGAFMLAAGENLIGRNPECAIWIDVSGVSRRHARVRLDVRTAARPPSRT